MTKSKQDLIDRLRNAYKISWINNNPRGYLKVLFRALNFYEGR